MALDRLVIHVQGIYWSVSARLLCHGKDALKELVRGGIGGVLHDDRGRMVLTFSETVGIMESNEAELRAIRRALEVRSTFGNGNLCVESDPTNAISWLSSKKVPLWKLTNITRTLGG